MSTPEPISLVCVICVICAICGLIPNAGASPLDAFLERHCFECHDDVEAKGDLNLLETPFNLEAGSGIRTWIHVHDRIAAGEMPPGKKPRPSDAEIAEVLGFLSPKLHAADKARREVVQRRLNRVEYENTVRDLLHIDAELQDFLPEDAIKDGFDNIGDALAISTEQMQAYLAAAEHALDSALVDTDARKRSETRTITKWLSRDGGKGIEDKVKGGQFQRTTDDFIVVFMGAGYVPTNVISAPADGWYDMELICRAHNTHGQPLTVVIHQNNDRLRTSQILGFYQAQAGPEDTVIKDRIKLQRSDTLKPLPFDLPYVKPDPNYEGPGLAIGPITLKGPLMDRWPPASHTGLLGDVDPENATATDAEHVLQRFLPSAFRRPLVDSDMRPYLDLVTDRLDQGRPFLDALKVGLTAALCSPDFLFLYEPADPETVAGIPMGEFAFATRLSYFLWSSAPDVALFEKAESDQLRDPAVLHAEVERMLDDPRAARFTGNFTGQWLKLRDIDFTTPDKSLFPEFDAHLQASMIEESHRFFDEILSKDLPVQNFIDSDFAMLNERLARHYGIPGVDHFELRRVSLPADSPRGGVLTQGAVLKVTANGTNSSPVMRGVWVLDNIMGRPAPPPPAGVPAVEPDIRGATTLREQLDRHRDSEKCATCHRNIDPPGFALESFNPVGGFRDHYRSMGAGEKVDVEIHGKPVRYKKGLPVDPSGVTADDRKFAGVREFKALLLEDESLITRTLTEKLLTYALGRSLGFSDRPEVDAIVSRVAANNHGFRRLIHEITQSEAFRAP